MTACKAEEKEVIEMLRRIDERRRRPALRTLARDALVVAIVGVAMVLGFLYGLTL